MAQTLASRGGHVKICRLVEGSWGIRQLPEEGIAQMGSLAGMDLGQSRQLQERGWRR
jgi:hypothetical protein